MPDLQTVLELVLQPEIALPILLASMLLSFYVGRRTSDGTAQVQELEGALADLRGAKNQAQDELGDYQAKVTNHFTETSEKLHDLTLQYRAVYDHLAKGAGELCPDSLQKLEGGLGLDALPEEGTSSASGLNDKVEPELETDLDDVTEPVESPAVDESQQTEPEVDASSEAVESDEKLAASSPPN